MLLNAPRGLCDTAMAATINEAKRAAHAGLTSPIWANPTTTSPARAQVLGLPRASRRKQALSPSSIPAVLSSRIRSVRSVPDIRRTSLRRITIWHKILQISGFE